MAFARPACAWHDLAKRHCRISIVVVLPCRARRHYSSSIWVLGKSEEFLPFNCNGNCHEDGCCHGDGIEWVKDPGKQLGLNLRAMVEVVGLAADSVEEQESVVEASESDQQQIERIPHV